MIYENEKLSLTKCKSVLQSDGSVYTDEQVIAIRNFLYRMAEWDYEVYLKSKIRDLAFEKEKQKQSEEPGLDNAA